MFNVQPYPALRYVVTATGTKTKMTWEPCTVIGVDASSREIVYLVESRTAGGDYSIEREQFLRRPAQ